MSQYIVCRKKRNNPRIDIRVCQKKCNLKENCKEYISLQKILSRDADVSLPISSQPGPIGMPETLNTSQ